VTVAHKEIGIQLTQIQRNMSNAVSTVDDTQNTILFAHSRQPLKGKTNPWNRNDCVEDCYFGVIPIINDPRDGLGKCVEDVRMRAWEGVGEVLPGTDLTKSKLWIRLDN
jgi:hypothetical protein